MKSQIYLFLSIILIISMCEEDISLQEYEIKHIEVMRNNSAECTLFLKKDSSFPLKNPGKVILVGSGARDTTKRGTGSGDVESRYFTTCEEGLENAGFEIVSKDWLDKCPEFKKSHHKDFVEYIYRITEKYDSNEGHISFGAVEPESEYDFPLDYSEAEACFLCYWKKFWRRRR